MENSHRCEICNIDNHRAFCVKHLGSKKPLESFRQSERIIPELFFKEEQAPIRKKKYITVKHQNK